MGGPNPSPPLSAENLENWPTFPPLLSEKNQKSANPLPPLSEIIFGCTQIIEKKIHVLRRKC